jgi:CHASE2 domain-containing sensor protein
MLARKRIPHPGPLPQRVVLFALLLSGVVLLAHFGLLNGVDARLSDLRLQLGSRPVTGDLALVDIDARSLEAIVVWPWP